jgi:hypothetical protein
MNIVGGRQFVEIPGDRTHELPPLLIRPAREANQMERAMQMASHVVESEDMLPPPVIEIAEISEMLEQRKLELALQLVEHYQGLVNQWRLGDSILEWIRQCETTFETRLELRPLLRPDIWPRASRVNFVTLLRDKDVDTQGIEPEGAVGMRLAFRQPPPLRCFSDQFLMYLQGKIATTAFETWAQLSPAPNPAFPPERFHFDVVKMDS